MALVVNSQGFAKWYFFNCSLEVLILVFIKQFNTGQNFEPRHLPETGWQRLVMLATIVLFVTCGHQLSGAIVLAIAVL